MVDEVVASGFWCPKCTFLEDPYDVTPEGVNLEKTYCQSCGCKSGIHVAVNVVRTD